MLKTLMVTRVALALILGGAVALPVAWSPAKADTQTVQKKKKKQTTQNQNVKKNYQATPPGQPNQAGMTDDCAFWYNVYGHMPVGCDKYGRSFRLWDN